MKNKNLFIGISMIVLAAMVWIFFPKKSKEVIQDVKKRLFLGNASFPIKKGKTGLQVLYFQAWLNLFNHASLVLDGIYGPKTEAAARRAKYSVDIVTKYGVELTNQLYKSDVLPKLDEIKDYLSDQNIDFV